MVGYIDIHCHLDHCKITERIDDVMNKCITANVVKIVAAGVNKETNRKVLELSEKYNSVQACLGIYPMDALQAEMNEGEFPGKENKFSVDEELNFIKKNKDKIVAIGECGLDYKTGEEHDKQKEVFLKQIELAEKIKKPIIVHSRKAEHDVIEMLESSNVKALLHCFCGKKKLVIKGDDLGYCFSIPTNVVNSQQFQDMVKLVNINQIFCETDSPYLSPVKGEWNEPANVVRSYEKVAEIKGFELEEVMKTIYLNYQKVFQ